MKSRIRLVSIVAIAISVFTITTAQAAVNGATATSRVIVETVLAEFGVQTDESIIELVSSSVPESALNSSLVAQVSAAINSGIDPAALIIATTESNGDGMPDLAATNQSSNKATNGVQSGTNVVGSGGEDASENPTNSTGNHNDDADGKDDEEDDDYDHSQDDDDD